MVADFYIRNRNDRIFLKRIRKITFFIRSLRIPIYKNIFDTVNIRSYFVVLERILNWKNPKICFEWGPGLNTELFSDAGAKVYSVEHDKKWLSIYNENKPSNVELIFSKLNENDFLEYPNEIKKINERIDVAFVDARCRVQCILSCKDKSVPIVIMHDSRNPVTMEETPDSAPPVFNEGRFYKEGYESYDYFIEIIDLRTILLLEQEKDFKELINIFSDFYIISGKTHDYDTMKKII